MTTLAFDTLAFANHLKQVGIKSEHAEAQAEATAQAVVTMMNDVLATKQDLYLLKHDLQQQMHDLKQQMHDLQQQMKDLENRLTIRLGSMLAAGITILSALMVVLHV